MRITEAAERLGTSPRMLRYRDLLGLLPPVRVPAAAQRAPASPGRAATRRAGAGSAGAAPAAPAHRRFSEDDLAAAALALRIEQRYDISPAALAFGLRVLAEPGVRADVAELGRRIGRVGPPPARALDFEKQRAMRLLGQVSRTAGRAGRTSARAGGEAKAAGTGGAGGAHMPGQPPGGPAAGR